MSLLVRGFNMMIGVDVETGALNQLWASTSNVVKSGEFYFPWERKLMGMFWTIRVWL